MHKFTAKNIIKDKFWIIELNGTNVGTVKFTGSQYVYFNNDTKKTLSYTEKEFKNEFKTVNTKIGRAHV